MKLLLDIKHSSSENARGVLDEDLVVDLEKGFTGDHVFLLDGKTLGFLRGDILTICRGYEWDLCSPSIKIHHKWFGTPTTRREALGSCLHDFTRSVMDLPCSPWTRQATDELFWDALVLKDSHFKRTYFFAVNSFLGTLFIRLTKKPTRIICEKHEH